MFDDNALMDVAAEESNAADIQAAIDAERARLAAERNAASVETEETLAEARNGIQMILENEAITDKLGALHEFMVTNYDTDNNGKVDLMDIVSAIYNEFIVSGQIDLSTFGQNVSDAYQETPADLGAFSVGTDEPPINTAEVIEAGRA